MNNRILYLPLKAKWYEMIESRRKTEEYREIKPYWINRLIQTKTKYDINKNPDIVDYAEILEDLLGFEKYNTVQFSYGYTKRTMQFDIEKIEISTGKTEWGVEEGKKYFVIKFKKMK